MSKIDKFNIRVYGLFINENEEILLADEKRFGMQMTKFPGGGLNPGEGIKECLFREGKEEFGQEIMVIRHYYTTDFFQQALFYENQQLISVYYLTAFIEKEKFRIATNPFDFSTDKGEIISFRYKKIISIEEEELSFPIDKHVLSMLKKDRQ